MLRSWAGRACFGVAVLVLGAVLYDRLVEHRAARLFTLVTRGPPTSSASRTPEIFRSSAPADVHASQPNPQPLVGDAVSELDLARLDLADSDAALRVEGVAGLASAGGDAVVAELVAAGLHDPDARVREEAIRALPEIVQDAAIPVLAQAVRDDDDGVRRAALAALGELESPGAVLVLRATADDARHPDRATATLVLGDR